MSKLRESLGRVLLQCILGDVHSKSHNSMRPENSIHSPMRNFELTNRVGTSYMVYYINKLMNITTGQYHIPYIKYSSQMFFCFFLRSSP